MKKIDEILEYFERKNIFAKKLTHNGQDIVLAVKIDGNEFTIVILDEKALRGIGRDGLPAYERNHNFLRSYVYKNKEYMVIDDFQVENQRVGYGQIIMNYLLKIMEYIELNDKITFQHIKGELSFVDKSNGNWKKSLPFYKKFQNRIVHSSKYCDNLSFELFDNDGLQYIDIYKFIEEAPNGEFYYRIV